MDCRTWISIIECFFTFCSLCITTYIAVIANRRLDSEKTMKIYFIDEVKSIRLHEEHLFNMINSNKVYSQKLKVEVGILNRKISDLMILLYNQYGIDKLYLESFQWKYEQLFSDDEDYTSNFKTDKEFKFNYNTVDKISKYRNNELYLFNKLVLEINNSKIKK